MNTKNNSIPSKIYFFDFGYKIRGGAFFFARLASFFKTELNIPIGFITFKDDFILNHLNGIDFEFIDYTAPHWSLKDNSLIFVPSERIGCIKDIQGENIRIATIFWETEIAWDVLYQKKELSRLSNLLNKTQSISFMDHGCWIAGKRQLLQEFPKNYIPLFFPVTKKEKKYKPIEINEINLVWLGRLDYTKVLYLINVIDNFYSYKTNKKKQFHIIGSGESEKNLKNYCDKYKDDIEFIFTGILAGNKLETYLLNETDVAVAMGTSMLNCANLGLPTIGCHETPKPFSSDKFIWIFDEPEYSLGLPYDNADFSGKELPFNNLLDDLFVFNNYERIGRKCREYARKSHGNLYKTAQISLDFLKRSSLYFSDLKRCLKFIPYTGESGVYIEKFSLFGIPLVTIKHHRNIERVYFLGIQILRKTFNFTRIQWRMFGITICNKKLWGRYSFPGLTPKKTRQIE